MHFRHQYLYPCVRTVLPLRLPQCGDSTTSYWHLCLKKPYKTNNIKCDLQLFSKYSEPYYKILLHLFHNISFHIVAAPPVGNTYA